MILYSYSWYSDFSLGCLQPGLLPFVEFLSHLKCQHHFPSHLVFVGMLIIFAVSRQSESHIARSEQPRSKVLNPCKYTLKLTRDPEFLILNVAVVLAQKRCHLFSTHGEANMEVNTFPDLYFTHNGLCLIKNGLQLDVKDRIYITDMSNFWKTRAELNFR